MSIAEGEPVPVPDLLLSINSSLTHTTTDHDIFTFYQTSPLHILAYLFTCRLLKSFQQDAYTLSDISWFELQYEP